MQPRDKDRHSGRIVLIADPRSARRKQLAAPVVPQSLIEAASLCEAFPLAEQAAPWVIALSADFVTEPEIEGLVRLAGMLRSRVFLYTSEGHAPVRAASSSHLPCIRMQAGDGIFDLLERLDDPRAHLSASASELHFPEVIAIGASTGGIAAIESVLAAFPADCPPTLVVQHIRDGFVPGLVRRLDGNCRPRVVEASEGAQLRRGVVFFASDPNCHLTVTGQSALRCTLAPGPMRHGHRPAVDPLFESLVPIATRVSAALLTGMGTDGAEGLGALRRAGAHTIAQDRDTSVVWGMPRAAVETGAVAEVLPIDRIGSALLAPQLRKVSTRGEVQ